MSIGPGYHTSSILEAPITRVLSLPHEILQTIFSLIIDFEPWTYNSIAGCGDASITSEELLLHTRDAMPINTTPVRRATLGLSSESNWLLFVLSRHPHHLSRCDKSSVSSAVTQAMRRMNDRVERFHWEGKASIASHQIPAGFDGPDSNDLSLPSSQEKVCHRGERSPTSDDILTTRYHTIIQSEEEAYLQEDTIKSAVLASSLATALIAYHPAPVLTIRHLDVIQLMHQHDLNQVVAHVTALLAAVLITLAQCRLSLLEIHEQLERDTPIQSVEHYESKDFAPPRMSSQSDRMRSMSGSTVAEAYPQAVSLSLSPISTVYNTSDRPKQVKWAEKRMTEDDVEDTGISPKRPKLSEYKQVSSGRVATLMDRFEKFHL